MVLQGDRVAARSQMQTVARAARHDAGVSTSLAAALLLIVVPAVTALIDCLAKDRQNVRRLPQGAWVLVILLLAPLGAIAWFVAGRPRQRQVEPPVSMPPPGWEPAIGWEPAVGAPDHHDLPTAYEPPPPSSADPMPREPR
jgi:hypothetical protein